MIPRTSMPEYDAVLQVAQCPGCKYTMWPLAPHCPCCLTDTIPYDLPARGRILEYSGDAGRYFCVAEFEYGIRLMCELDVDSAPASGQEITLDRIERSGASYSFVAVYAKPHSTVQSHE